MATTDPRRNYNFEVKIDNKAYLFKSVAGLKQSVEIIEYRSGTDDSPVRKIPGQPTTDTITLSRGVASDADGTAALRDWALLTCDPDRDKLVDGYERTVLISLLDRAGNALETWKVKGAWISEYTLSDLDATANDVLIEEVILQHLGLTKSEN